MDPQPTFGWSYTDISLAIQVLNTLIANLDEKDTQGRHRAKSDYLRYHLCPLFGLIQDCLEDIEADNEHPRRDSWMTSLTIIRDSYYRFEAKLDKQNSHSTRHLDSGSEVPIISGTWTWTELSGNIDAIKSEIGDALVDVEWLINLELRSKFEEDVQTLERLSAVIEAHGATIATYRRGLQEVLRDVQANEQDCETVQDLFQGSTAEFAQKLIKHRRETRAMSSTLQQVHNILIILAGQLLAQRTRCSSETGKRQLSQLQSETKKRAAAISRLCQRYNNAEEMGSEIVRMIRKLGLTKRQGQGQASDDEVLKTRLLMNVSPRLERLYDKFRNRTAGGDLTSRELSTPPPPHDEQGMTETATPMPTPMPMPTTSFPQTMTRTPSSPAAGSDGSIYSSTSQDLPHDGNTNHSYMMHRYHTTGVPGRPNLRFPRSTTSNDLHESSEIDEIMPLFALRIPSSTISWPPPPTRSAPPVPSSDPESSPDLNPNPNPTPTPTPTPLLWQPQQQGRCSCTCGAIHQAHSPPAPAPAYSPPIAAPPTPPAPLLPPPPPPPPPAISAPPLSPPLLMRTPTIPRRSSRRSPSRSSSEMSYYPSYAVSGPLFSRIEAMAPVVKA